MRDRRAFTALACACVAALIASSVATHAADAIPEKITTLARDLESSLNACDTELFDSSISWSALLSRGTADLDVSEEVRTEFARGIARGFVLGEEICKTVQDSGSYVLLSVRQVDREHRALFRIVGENGLNYHDLLLSESDDGRVEIHDMFIYSLGEWVSQTARRGFLPLAAQLKKGSLDRVEPGENLYLDNIPNILKMQSYYQSEEFDDALAVFYAMPDELKQNRNILMVRFAVAAQVGGVEYDAAMLDLKNTFPGDPSLDLVLIDHYFNRREYDQALRIVDRIDRNVGGDPYLDFMRANVLFAGGRTTEARKAARRAIEHEPELQDPYWTLVTISLDEKEFVETARLLDQIEGQLGIIIGDLSMVPEYAEFMKSDAYTAWEADRWEQR
jgi:tetratricopeptide (TPR) repeat protein